MTYDEMVLIMTEYIKLKMYLKDWHAVADAAMDLRELEAGWRER